MVTEDTHAPGVYLYTDGATPLMVHAYQEGDYGLEDIAEYFGLGQITASADAEPIELMLDTRDLRQLKINADAYSFDFEQAFIEMCLEMARAGLAAGCDPCRFVGNF